jgi:hypothetical protein
MSDDDIERRVEAFIRQTEDYVRGVTAESRALRTILQTFLRRALSTSADPRQSFENLKADTLDILAGEAERDAALPDAQRAAEATRFQAAAILSELETWLLGKDGETPQRPN